MVKNISPFENDPFSLVAAAFDRLYPGHEYTAAFVAELKDENGKPVYGETVFPDDGSAQQLLISAETPVRHAVEVFAHELAHVATPEDTDHGLVWEEAFDRIAHEYIRICKELLGEPEKNEIGKCKVIGNIKGAMYGEG